MNAGSKAPALIGFSTHMLRSARRAGVGVLMLVALPGTASAAATYLEAYATASDSGGSETVVGTEGAVFASRSGEYAGFGRVRGADASASAAFGTLRAQSSANGTNDGATSGASARFHDTVTITAPGVATGTPGLFSFAMEVEGSLVADGAAHATWILSSGVGSVGPRILGAGEVTSSSISGDPFGGYYDSGLWLFHFGEPFVIGVTLGVGTTAGSSVGSGSASAMFGNTATWQGFSAVESAGTHIPYPEYFVTSASGLDWSLPVVVPVPGAALFFASALVVLAARASKSKASR